MFGVFLFTPHFERKGENWVRKNCALSHIFVLVRLFQSVFLIVLTLILPTKTVCLKYLS